MVNGQKYYCLTEDVAEILMIITSVVILICVLRQNIQALIGSIGDTFTSLLLSSAYALFLPLMSYMYSQAQQYKLEVRALIILSWMVIIEINRILGDSIWELRKSLEQMVRLLWVIYLIWNYPHWQGVSWVSLLILCICSIGYEIRKGFSFYNANDSYLIGKNPKLIHSYVKRVMLQDDLKTTPIDSCDYIVMGETNHEIDPCSYGYLLGEQKSNSEGLFTVGRAFQLNPSEAFTSVNPSWRDTCLSLALAKMLRRRFANLPADEAGCRKALDFVVEGLIDYIGSNKDIETDKNDGEKTRSKRVFGIIQEELQLVSDFLNVKVPAYNYYKRYNIVADVIGILIIFGNWVYLGEFTARKMYSKRWPLRFLPRLKAYRYNNCSYYVHTTRGSPVGEFFYFLDEIITSLLFCAYLYLKFVPLLTISLSKSWGTLNSVTDYIKDAAKWNRFKFGIPSIYWSYSENFAKVWKEARNYSSILDLESKTILFCIGVKVSTLIYLSNLNLFFIRRNIPLPFRTLVHSTDAKEAILESLKKSVARLSVGETSLQIFDQASLLTNGKTSLQNYNMESLNWTCTPNGSTTEAILVWHIATTLYHHQESSPQQNNDPHQEPANHENNNSIKEQEVALELSNYCHYLVEFLPELLPDEVEWTQKMYESVTKEIFGAIPPRSNSKKSTKKDNYNYVLLHAGWVGSSVVGKGVKLANQLMDYDKEGKPVWAMLADFWAEMMLFIAPSDNVEGHKQILYRQELITQLWALLTHAGIVTRSKPTDHQVDDSESPTDHQVHDGESNAFTEDMNV